MKLTPKQERFCLAYLETSNASEAYRQSYSAGEMKAAQVHEEACRLLKHPKVSARLASIQRPVIEAAQVTLATHLEQLAKLRDAAFADKEYSAAIAAEAHRGKAAGLYIDRKEIRTGALDDVPYEEKQAALEVVRAAIRKAKTPV